MTEIMDGLTKDMEADDREKLKAVFPQCFTEGRLDIDKLLSLCGEYIDDDFEKYEFKWKGKAECLKLAQKRSTATLRPCPEESVKFETTKNLYIEGDNLEVLKLLQTSYYRQVKMIYIDPPYNTGHDFIYEDDFKDTLARYKEVTSQTTKSNPESMGRFHTNWLNMMYPRLRLAASLLRDDGVIFISIDDHEVHNLRKLCDEVFGEENFIATVIWQKVYSPKNSAKHFSEDHDYILVYARNAELWRPQLLPRTAEMMARYSNPDNDPRGPWKPGDLSARNYYGEGTYPITCPSGREISGPPTGRYWVMSKGKFQELDADGRIWWGDKGDNSPAVKKFLSEVQDGVVPQTLWFYKDVGHTQEAKKEIVSMLDFGNSDDVFETPKPTKLIKKMLQIGTRAKENDIVLDFFSGSGTTGQAVMELNADEGGNRRFILVQLPEMTGGKDYSSIAEIGKERLRQAGKKVGDEVSNKSLTLDFGKLDGGPKGDDDFGFKVFKLDSSNLETWDPSPITSDQLPLLEERLNRMTARVKADRSDLDMVYEIMLKQGIPLTESIAALEIEGFIVYSVREDSLLLICLEKDLSTEAVKQMAALAPARIIFGQECFPDMTGMSNAKLSLRDAGIDFKFV